MTLRLLIIQLIAPSLPLLPPLPLSAFGNVLYMRLITVAYWFSCRQNSGFTGCRPNLKRAHILEKFHPEIRSVVTPPIEYHAQRFLRYHAFITEYDEGQADRLLDFDHDVNGARVNGLKYRCGFEMSKVYGAG